ncbi:Arv1-domain-containing protein [Microthyrium microscopicum]|uniref:Protein ARV n=1 Tax=Microthyrium microscopicum TaxID=703497 RepID=A0A6A6UPZ0_9PEZI|nr:Arv1-domain-containing protein [Microthyrium microscopicum]
MPICIECRHPVTLLYTEYSKADDRSLGKGVRLTQCPQCQRFADKYVEHDFVVLFIDLVLIKPQVYRHLLFNRLSRADDRFDPSIIRLGTLLLLFDVYLTWARIEKTGASPNSPPPTGALSAYPLLLQYLFFLVHCLLGTLSFHLPIRVLCTSPRLGWLRRLTSLPYYKDATALSTALLVSSCTKLFPILLIVWEYDLPSAASAVSWAVIVNNVAALEILMDCGYGRALALVIVGAIARATVGWSMLSAIGLQDRIWNLGDLKMNGVVSDSLFDSLKWIGSWS